MRARRPEVELILLDEPVRAPFSPPRRSGRRLTAADGVARRARAEPRVRDRRRGLAHGGRAAGQDSRLHHAPARDRAPRGQDRDDAPRGASVLAFLRGCGADGGAQTVVEFGTHAELLARGGSYASLYNASI